MAERATAADAWVFEYLTNPFVLAAWVLFCVGVAMLTRYFLKLRREETALNLVKQNVKNALGKNIKREAIEADLLLNISERPGDADLIIKQRIKGLRDIRNNCGTPNQSEMAEVLAAREGAQISIARYAANVLVLLGLCGAILGLSRLVFQMGPELRHLEEMSRRVAQTENTGRAPTDGANSVQKPVESLINTMAVSLEHTRGAFYASLTGVGQSIVILLMMWIVSRRQVSLLSEVEDFTATNLLPIFMPRLETVELSEVVTSLRESVGYLASLAKGMDDNVIQIGGSLQSLFTFVSLFNESLEELRDNNERTNAAQSSMIKIVEDFKGVAQQIEAHQSEAKNQIKDVMTSLSEGNKRLANAVDAWRDSYEKMLQMIQGTDRKVNYETGRVQDDLKQITHQTTGLLKASTEQQFAAFKVEAIDVLKTHMGKNRQLLSELVTAQQKFATDLKESARAEYRDLLVGMSSVIKEERAEYLAQFGSILQGHLIPADGQVGQGGEPLPVSGQTPAALASRSGSKGPSPMTGTDGSTNQFGEMAEQFSQLLRQVLRVLIYASVVICVLEVASGLGVWPESLGWRLLCACVIIACSFGAGYLLTRSLGLQKRSNG